ncbi:hypothetical protein [Gracilimonas halophila]|uniref:Uncharacterized protein n=1 Tax=Gracilimonas halophila TaxID=1834464 RepID=A0ABW5JG82_9BACT
MPEKDKFAHIYRSVLYGIIHLEKPRWIYWYGSGFGDFDIEWIDQPTIEKGTQVIHDIEQKMLELQREGTDGFPELDYYEYLEQIGESPQ